jgi:hypothetical protein
MPSAPSASAPSASAPSASAPSASVDDPTQKGMHSTEQPATIGKNGKERPGRRNFVSVD